MTRVQNPMRASRWQRLPGAVACAIGVVLVAASVALAPRLSAQPAASVDAGALVDEMAALQRRTQVLERQIELARGKEFYLVLDPAGGALTLMLRGAALQRYPILGVQVGHPRVSWIRRQAEAAWQGIVWSSGALDPPRQLDRLVVQSDEKEQDEADPEPPAIPPTAEELYPVPARYQIRFAGGVSIEVRPYEADEAAGAWVRFRAWAGARGRDVRAALFAAKDDALRLRVVLEPADAASLYRALPPDTRLIVLPGGFAGGAATAPPER